VGLFLGLDVGTTSVSVVLLDREAGRLVSGRSLPHGAGRSGAMAGRAELDLDVLWRVVQAALRDLVAETEGRGEVSAVGVTGQMHGLALVRADGTPAAPAITWQDQRAIERDETGAAYLERFVSEAGGPTAFERMGASPATGYLGPSLYWLRRQGFSPAPSVTACLIPDAIVARLAGGPPVTDPTDAASTGLYDVVSGAWDLAVLRGLGIPEALLAPVRASGEVAGRLRRDVAERVGLAAGLPVAVAIGDNQASFIGSVRDAGRALLVNIGTGAQVSALVSAFARGAGLEARPFPGGRYLLVGAGLYGGASYALLRDLYRQIGRAFFGARGDEGLYDRMNALAAEVPPGSDGLRCVPLFAGTRVDPTVRGSFTGVSPENLTPGHLARALLEGVADQLHALWDVMRPLAGARVDLVGAGNAITRNALLARILAVRFGLPLNLPAFDEPAALGAALVAGTAVGAFPDIDVAMGNMLRYRATVVPEPWDGV
jgi:sugar (pentulose or hexulose) kinase